VCRTGRVPLILVANPKTVPATTVKELITSYRLDNRNQAGDAKDSDEEEVILRRRKTTSERGQRRERDEFP
jgi:hypothetical protein